MDMRIINAESKISIEEHFKIVAGPGAGKTRFLINHIENVLQNSKRLSLSRKIACITYTNVGVDTIVSRLKDSNDHVEVSTIHSFLFTHIVKPYLFLISAKFDLGTQFCITSKSLDVLKLDLQAKLIKKLKSIEGKIFERKDYEAELEKVINKTNTKTYFSIIKEKSIHRFRNFESPLEHVFSKGYFHKTNLPGRYVSEDEMKSNIYWQVSPKGCVLRFKNKQDIYHDSLLKYKSFFWENGILHYDDVLAFAWEIINLFPDVLRVLRAKFPYFFVDEFQDTSPIQTAIIKKIAEKETIIGIIGDEAQSIYSFQGANVDDFKNFSLLNIHGYKIEDNWRSTVQIIDVLKIIRPDLDQKSQDNKMGEKPMILVGDSLKALEFVENKLVDECIYTLSFQNPTASALRNRLSVEEEKIPSINEILDFDSYSSNRPKVLIPIIKSIEFARVNLFNDAIKEICRFFKNKDNFKGHKVALQVIKKLLLEYDEIKTNSLFDLYERIVRLNLFDSGEYKMSKLTKNETIDKYKNIPYAKLILAVRLNKDETKHRTIHKAKGDEFDNVIVIVKGEKGYKYKEDRDLSFLLNPTIIDVKNENERVYYVACSRAMKNLFINIPVLSDTAEEKLKNSFEIKKIV